MDPRIQEAERKPRGLCLSGPQLPSSVLNITPEILRGLKVQIVIGMILPAVRGFLAATLDSLRKSPNLLNQDNPKFVASTLKTISGLVIFTKSSLEVLLKILMFV